MTADFLFQNLTHKIYFKMTSQKHRNFINEPMGEKSITELAGIGPVLGRYLEMAGFAKAYAVLGVFLVIKKDFNLFNEWMRTVCNANSKQAGDCYQCLHEWCENFL